MAYIYKITNQVNNKIYIGKTLETIQERWRQHRHDYHKKHLQKRPLYEAMAKYGAENFTIEEIEECDHSIVNERERYWIMQYRSYIGFEDAWGYNATLGGDGKTYCDYDWIYSLWLQGNNLKQIAKITGYCEDTARTALNEKGVTTEERKYRGQNARSRPIVMLDKDTLEELKVFASAKEAERWLNKPSGCRHIKEVARGERKTAYGYSWKFKES